MLVHIHNHPLLSGQTTRIFRLIRTDGASHFHEHGEFLC